MNHFDDVIDPADEWAAIADGVLHDPRCVNRSCLRCRNEDLTHALAAAIEWHERQRSNAPGESPLIDGWRALVNPPTAPVEDLLAPTSSPQGDGDDGSLYQAMLRGGNHLTGTGIQKL